MWGTTEGTNRGTKKRGKQGNIREELPGEGNKLGAIPGKNVEQTQGTKPTGLTKPTRSPTKGTTWSQKWEQIGEEHNGGPSEGTNREQTGEIRQRGGKQGSKRGNKRGGQAG